MIRALHYVGKMNRGGMETFIMNLYRSIDRNRVQFDFAVHGDKNGDFEEEILSMGGKFYNFPHMRKGPAAYKKAWKTFWREHKEEYAAFHFHTNSLANVIALEEAAKAGVPIRIVHAHSSFANKGKLQWLNDCLHREHQRNLSKYANRLFACSDKAAEWLFGGMSCDGLDVRIIKNGVDVEKYRMNNEIRDNIRKEFGFDETHKVIGHVGVFLPVKNHEFLIDVIENAYKLDNSVRAVLIGGGSLMEEIKNKVRSKNIEEIVTFTGVRADVNKILMAMDLLVMPSKYEGLPVSLVEAQADGVPLLVSDTITKDVAFNPNMEYYALSEGSENWAKKALDMLKSAQRYNSADNVTAAGFNIKETSELYMKIVGG